MTAAAMMLDAALELAESGWRVYRLNGKTPPRGSHGFHDATTDEGTIRAWWASKAWNIGARVPDSCVVLDIDPRNGGSLDALAEAAGCDLTETLTVRSGRGDGGRHLYYLRPFAEVTGRRLPTGIDLLTSTRGMVMPPSVHPETGGRYEWEHAPVAHLPVGLRDRLRPEPRPVYVGPASTGNRTAALISFVAALTEGSRNRGLFWAACRAVEAGATEDLFDEMLDAAASAGLPRREAEQVIASARKAVVV